MRIVQNGNDVTIFFRDDVSLDDPQSQKNEDCLKFKREHLISQEQLPLGVSRFNLREVNEFYLASSVMLTTELDMGPYGKGVVAKQTIPLNTVFIYMGSYGKSGQADGMYKYDFPAYCPNSLTVDAENIASIARQFQDLPKKHHPTVATENASPSVVYVKIRLHNQTGYLPIIILRVNRQIEMNELIGFQYSPTMHYWTKLEVAPALFKKNGALHRQTFGLKLTHSSGEVILPSLDENFLSTFNPGPLNGVYVIQDTSGFSAIYFPPEVVQHLQTWIRETLPTLAMTTGTYYQASYPLTYVRLPSSKSSLYRSDRADYIKLRAEDKKDCEILNRYVQEAILEKKVDNGQQVWLLNLEKLKKPAVNGKLQDGYGFVVSRINSPQAASSSPHLFFSQPAGNSEHASLYAMIGNNGGISQLLLKYVTSMDYNLLLSYSAMGVHPKAVDIFTYCLTHFSAAITDFAEPNTILGKSVIDILQDKNIPKNLAEQKEVILEQRARMLDLVLNYQAQSNLSSAARGFCFFWSNTVLNRQGCPVNLVVVLD